MGYDLFGRGQGKGALHSHTSLPKTSDGIWRFDMYCPYCRDLVVFGQFWLSDLSCEASGLNALDINETSRNIHSSANPDTYSPHPPDIVKQWQQPGR